MKNARDRIRIAIQKTGRLNEKSLTLLAHCGIQVKPGQEQLFYNSDHFPLDLLFVRDDDIPQLVAEGVCDFGIVGINVLREKSLQSSDNIENKIQISRYLDFALCRLAIAVPKNFSYQNLKSLEKCRIATSYPFLLAEFFEKNKVDIDITILTGSVELAPRLGMADGICDLVSTGATLAANHLREVETVFKSRAVLIRSSKKMTNNKQYMATIFQKRVEQSELASGTNMN